jgi:hypothetical protein
MQNRESGAPSKESEIEVTSAMIEAGVTVLWESCAVEHPLQADRLVIDEVYRAMYRAGQAKAK